MKIYHLAIIVILTSCKSVELKQPVWYFWPIKLHLGTNISIVSQQLSFDTTKYSKVGFARHLKEYKLKRSDLNNLTFNNNYSDSMRLNFYNNRLFSIEIFASENRRVEYLKFDIRGSKQRGLGLGDTFGNLKRESLDSVLRSIDTTFNYGKYRELSIRSTDGHMRYEYYENIVDNTANLTISNERMLKTMPHVKWH